MCAVEGGSDEMKQFLAASVDFSAEKKYRGGDEM